MLSLLNILLIFIVSTVILVAYAVHRFCYAPYRVLERYGIRGPGKPKAIVGHMPLIMECKGFLEFLNLLYVKYNGPVSGYYIGREPCILLNDPELIKQVTIKEFGSFMDHAVFPNFIPKKYIFSGLFAENGETWRQHRQIISPAFSASKMKMMVPLIKKSTSTLVEKVDEIAESGASTDVMKLFGAFTMESILAIAFGRIINLQKGEADEVTRAAKGVFDAGRDPRVQMCQGLLGIFPIFERPVQYYLTHHTKVVEPFVVLYQTALKLVEARKSGTAKQAKYKDILQLMIDASDEPTDTDEAAATPSECPVQHHSTASKSKLTNEEIVSFATSFLGAGYETTANTLSYTAYLLAINPSIQERLQSEIDGYFDEKPDATPYEASHEITYLDNVIQETLRVYPTAALTNRRCLETTTIGDVTFPKGVQIMIPILELHHDPKYWDEPDKFNPDRFTAEERAKRPATVHLPFGYGPRNCIGMRFALLEAKMALIELLKQYTFVRAPDTEVPLKTMLGFTLTPKNNAIFLKVVRRN